MNTGTDVRTEVNSNTNDVNLKKYRCFMLTINNPSDNDETLLKEDKTKFLVYQIERGENGTEHIQALIYYANPRTWPKKRYPRAHIEVTHDIEAGIKYCSKTETRIRGPYTSGTKPEQGKRTDLEACAIAICNGSTIKEIAVTNPSLYVKYHKGLKALKEEIEDKERDINNPPKVYWYWGGTGLGKTRTAIEKHVSYYIKDGTQWWNNYQRQDAIIIDDFDGKWPFRDLLRLLDRYPYQGQTKGGYININSPYIYITCEHHPKDIWKWDSESNMLGQILRRITEIKHFV